MEIIEDYWYWAKVLEVKDGDTVQLKVDLGFQDITLQETFRLHILDTHERRRIKRHGVKVTEAEVVSGKAATEVAKNLILESKVRVQTFKATGMGPYCRWICKLYFIEDNEWKNYTLVMQDLGFDRNLNPL